MRTIATVTALIALAAASSALAVPAVDVVTVEGIIDPPTAHYIIRGINMAERDGAQALVIRMDTPGGLDKSMRDIIQKILSAQVPVIVYVWPNGARAASAGVFITYASHIAAMAPTTNLGSAHPVAIGPGGAQMDKTMSEKVVNDAAKYIKSIAERRGRNAKWAEEAVRKSVNLTAKEAKAQNVIDYVANSLHDLLRQVDGKSVDLDGKKVTLHTVGAPLNFIGMSPRERFLDFLADPNVAYILLLIAVYGIIFELQNPGAILPGVLGGISLILFLYSFAVLPLNAAGLALIALAIILFLVDAMVPSHGILTAGGIIAFAMGSFMLFETGTPAFRISLQILIAGVLVTSAFFVFLVQTGIRALKRPYVSGPEGMVGVTTVARTDINPEGKVFVEGAWWTAQTYGPPIKKGERVKIVEVRGLKVIVEKEGEP